MSKDKKTKQYMRDTVEAIGALAAAKVAEVEKTARDAFRVFEAQAKSMQAPPAPEPTPTEQAPPPEPPTLTEQWQALKQQNPYVGAAFYRQHQNEIDNELFKK